MEQCLILIVAPLPSFLPVVVCVTGCLPNEEAFFLWFTTQALPVAQSSNQTTVKRNNQKTTKQGLVGHASQTAETKCHMLVLYLF